jgi:cytoskeleton protein RodZ
VDAVTDNAGPERAPSPGQALAAQRERQGLGRADVAQRLHMSAWQIEALEADDYGRLPKGPFLRGFVRNYAKIVGVDAEPLLAMLAEGMPKDARPRIVVPTQNIRFDPLGERLSNPYVKAATLASVAVLVAFAAMYWWLFIKPKPPALAGTGSSAVVAPSAPRGSGTAGNAASGGTAATPAQPAPAPQMIEPARSEAAKTPPAAKLSPAKVDAANAAAARTGAAKPSPARADAAKTDASASDAAQAAAAPLAGGKLLRFHFAGESWVEVRDARGKIIMQRLNPPNSDAQIAGRPPFTLIIGNAPDVKMYYNDREVPLEPHTQVAVARFTLE